MTPEPNRRILLIDDNRAIHDDFQKILCPSAAPEMDRAEADFFGDAAPVVQPLHFELASAFQGLEGVELLRSSLAEERPFAMAFLDVRMPPGIDGIATAERLWQLSPDLQIVLCTAYSDYSWQETIERLGQSDRLLVLKKPFAAVEALQMASALTEKWTLTQLAQRKLDDTERIVAERTLELLTAYERLEAEMEQRKKAEAHLLRAQRLESIGTLASGIAHDINNMLSPILLSVPLLRGELDRETREIVVSTIQNSAERAAGIVKQVLTFARGTESRREVLAPRDLLRELEKITSETFPRSLTISCRCAADLGLVHADPTQLHQVLMNLCVNARDAMPDGGTLTLEAENRELDSQSAAMTPGARPGRYVVVRSRDTGSGIPAEIIEQIFDPFFTTKPVGQGTGLGLSTAAGIIRSHGGFITVQSTVGKGTTFEVFLPEAIGEAAAAPPAEAAPAPDGGGELILIVDDEAGIRDVTEATLTTHGYRAMTAADGAQAITIYAEYRSRIGAVLTDVAMPIVDGLTLCRALQRLDPGVRVIASTGHGEDSRVREMQSLKIHSVLHKPFRTEQLLTTLHDALS